MEEYQPLLDKYLGTPSWDNSTPTLGNNMELAKSYMEHYWLSDSEYEKYWEPILMKLFISNYEDSHSMFPDSYEVIAMRGGILFDEENFTLLTDCFRSVGDKYFVIIENSFGLDPPFKLKYTTDISWHQFKNGDFITTVVVDMPHREYCVYSESGKCAMYAASDRRRPLNLVAFKKEYEDIFKRKFRRSKEEWSEIYNDWLPEIYKGYVINNSQ